MANFNLFTWYVKTSISRYNLPSLAPILLLNKHGLLLLLKLSRIRLEVTVWREWSGWGIRARKSLLWINAESYLVAVYKLLVNSANFCPSFNWTNTTLRFVASWAKGSSISSNNSWYYGVFISIRNDVRVRSISVSSMSNNSISHLRWFFLLAASELFQIGIV